MPAFLLFCSYCRKIGSPVTPPNSVIAQASAKEEATKPEEQPSCSSALGMHWCKQAQGVHRLSPPADDQYLSTNNRPWQRHVSAKTITSLNTLNKLKSFSCTFSASWVEDGSVEGDTESCMGIATHREVEAGGWQGIVLDGLALAKHRCLSSVFHSISTCRKPHYPSLISALMSV